MGEPVLRERAPEPALDVEKLYQHRFSAASKRTKERVWRVVVRDFLQRWVKPDDTVLDLGCGYGEFLNHLKCRRRIGVDFNPDSIVHLHDTVEFHQGDVTDLSFLPDESVQVVFTSNMLEHLRAKADVEQLLIEARRVLTRGGHLIAMGPNMRCLHGRYWDFWDHNVAITDRSLVEALEYLDFEIVTRHAKFLPYTTQSLYPQAPFFVKLYLRTPIAWHVMGKQFLVRARKP